MKDRSFETPPLYRRFCAGGADSLGLPLRGIVLFLGTALLTAMAWGAAAWYTGSGLSVKMLSVVAVDLATSLILGAMAGRWLGSRTGVLTGMTYLVSSGVLSYGHCSLTVAVTALMLATAWGTFARANVLGRLPIDQQGWLRMAFFIVSGMGFLLSGPGVLLVVVVACSLYLLSNQDRVGLSFLIDPRGIAIVVVLGLVRLAMVGVELPLAAINNLSLAPTTDSWTGHLASMAGRWKPLLVTVGPWLPLLAWMTLRGLRHGYLAIPIWRLTVCWFAAGLLLASVGILQGSLGQVLVLAPVSLMAGAGLDAITAVVRRGMRRSGQARGASTVTRKSDWFPGAHVVRESPSPFVPRRMVQIPRPRQTSFAAGLDGRTL